MVFRIIIVVLLALFAWDYWTVRQDALCAHATVVNMGGHK